MSNLQRYENLKQIVVQTQPTFDELAKIHGAVNYKREAAFALQILENSDYLQSVAMANQDSLKNAVVNVAAIGLSLSPVHKLAYLVPRDKKVCLDISYQGLVKLAIDCGAIKWCVADLVYANDAFTLHGFGKEPEHNFKPFSTDRGDLVGGYCTAKTPDGDFITIVMEIAEIDRIRDRSEAFKKKTGPWISDESEMIKKTLIKRASKSWPKKAEAERFSVALHLDDEPEAIETTATKVEDDKRSEGFTAIREALAFINRAENVYLSHLVKTCRRDLKKLEDLTDVEMTQAIVMLRQLVDQKKAKDAKEKLKADEQMSELDAKLGLKNENNTENK